MAPGIAETLLASAPFSPLRLPSFSKPPAWIAVSGGVVPISLDVSTRAGKTFVSAPASSPDAVGRGALLAGL